MAIDFYENKAVFKGVVSVEDAEPLLEALQKVANPVVDLADCTYFHPANIQVLLAAGAVVKAWPTDVSLSMWLQSVLLS
jgi:hypothetical protein